jgi:hypothetical protein
MDTQHQFKFIEGSFSADEARKAILSLIAQKIQYHQHEVFSNTVRFGHDITHSQKRVHELEDVYHQIKQLIADADDKNLHVNVHSSIHITLEKAV